ncbi:hypothetical protein B0I35DRAFT_1012 [Stachybotrys elegans]|uniref:CBM-cenC domain-containing protein n=1 Tax=Stachybotrys elegans TaxID=80388 RepID=A0A8K0T006_9HYPO|nr:hypothetical protein B0I35DRAFT_1012 [Stachybotrys elegans]
MTKGVNYPASRISSACSCIGVPATTLSVTFTAGTSTVTETSTSLQTASTTVTAWETVETTFVDGVETVTVPHPALINMDFETGNLDGWIEKKGTGGPDAFTVQVVSEAGPSGNPNKAVKITNNLNQGYDYLEMNQSILAEAGAVYRISVAAKSTASNAGATIPKMTGYFWLRRQPLSLILSFSNAGIPLGNGWYKFTYDFRMPDGKSGESYLFFDFQRNASPISTFLDDITIQRL